VIERVDRGERSLITDADPFAGAVFRNPTSTELFLY
jgi:hypothetical protein